MRPIVALASALAVAACSALRAPRPVEIADPGSPCARLRASYPSFHGLPVFADPDATQRSIAYCFPVVRGMGVMGYNVEVAVPRPGPVTLTLTDLRPVATFVAAAIHGTCAGDNTGRSHQQLGTGTAFRWEASPGAYCVMIVPQPRPAGDVWATLSVTRP